jgi:benzoyl-CoA reductase/2-hydroxyglutaryl-CoA dehydratase subunit BcrC/BadD/HgdB
MDKKEITRKGLGLERYYQEREWFNFLYQMLAQDPSETSQLSKEITEITVSRYDEIIRCAEEGKPFIMGYFCAAPEIYEALDLPWYMIMATPFLAASAPYLLEDIDAAERMGLGTDWCTACRLTLYYIEAGLTPKPNALVALIHPCDAATMLHQAVYRNKRWRDVPIFAMDPPYFEDQRGIDYYAEELKRMVAFLEEHTGRKLDIDRLREICLESNKQYELWLEYAQLRRAVPCPHGWAVGGPQCFAITQVFQAGRPRGTAWMRKLVDHTERMVKEKKGPVAKERIRYFWFDLLPFGWVFEFLPWLEEEWGAVMVMDMFGYTPYTLIDTRNEDTMLKGIAKRNLYESPMVRQARGIADYFASDITRVVKDYKIDCVIWPGHMGHKDGSASTGIMREVCRDLGVPYIHIGLDLFDKRYTTPEQCKDKISQFFTAMGLG